MKRRVRKENKAGRQITSIAALKRELKRREAELKRLERLEKALRARLVTIERQKGALTGVADAIAPARKPRRAKRTLRRSKRVPAKAPAAVTPAKMERAVKPSKKGPRRKTASVASLVIDIARERPKGVTPAEFAELLLKRGVKTKSKNFRKMITIAVAKNPGLKRIRKGVYTARE